ncbi:hypothetical protein F66182_8063 [Fusarium sp. NRRL 66182]|nr:hypothetical protein F66182_8063 [Fusarium sp. NRRL 66182]
MDPIQRVGYEPREMILKLSSHDQVMAELEGIVEAMTPCREKLCENTNMAFRDLWPLLTSLLDQYYSFHLAASHSKASDNARQLPQKHGLHYRMLHDVCPLVEKPASESSEHAIDVLHLVYSEMSFLQEVSGSPCWTWFRCKGKIAEYRMLLENDATARLNWHQQAIQQYTQLADRDPTTGLPYHHLAILEQQDPMRLFFNLVKSLAVEEPFLEARRTILQYIAQHVPRLDRNCALTDQDYFFTAISCLIIGFQNYEQLGENSHGSRLTVFLASFDIALAGIENSNTFSIRPCPELAILLHQLLLAIPSYGDTARFHNGLSPFAERADDLFSTVVDRILGSEPDTTDIGLWRFSHVLLILIHNLLSHPTTMKQYGYIYHLELLAPILNMAERECDRNSQSDKSEKPTEDSREEDLSMPLFDCPLPEDYLMRGFSFARDLFPEGWFENPKYDFEERRVHERTLEKTEMLQYRMERIVWMRKRLSLLNSSLSWDGSRFQVRGVLCGPPSHNLDTNMPEVVKHDIERGRSVKSVCVDPASAKEVTRTEALWAHGPAMECECDDIDEDGMTSQGDDPMSADHLAQAKSNRHPRTATGILSGDTETVTLLTASALDQLNESQKEGRNYKCSPVDAASDLYVNP